MEEKEIHLRDYLRIINKRKYTVLTFFTITFIVVVIATFTTTPLYLASTRVLVEKNTASALDGMHSYTPYDPEFLETQYQIIKSVSVAKKVVESFDVDKVYDRFFPEDDSKPSLFKTFKAWFKDLYASAKKMIGIEMIGMEKVTIDPEDGFEMAVPLTKTEKLAQFIQNGISVEPVQNSRVVEIRFMSANPALAMGVSNALARAYIDELLDMRMETSNYSIRWMTKKS